MLMALVSLFAVGCGDSGEDFVVTGNQGNNGANTGAVTFQFARAQQTVPAATALFDIRFFSANGLQVFEQLNIPFNTTITVQNVPTSATRAVVTAKNAAGIPLATIDYSLNVVGGGTANAVPGTSTLVTFDTVTATPDPTSVAIGGTQQISLAVGFSNGDSLSGAAAGGTPVFTSSAPAVATVNATGLVTGVTAGSATITVAYNLNGVTRTDTVAVTVTVAPPAPGALVANPTSATLTNTTATQVFSATINGAPVNFTGNVGTFTGTVAAGNLSYDNATRTLTATGNATGSAVLTLTSGTATTNVPVTVNRGNVAPPVPPVPPGTPARLEVSPSPLLIAPGTNTTTGSPLQVRFFPANSTVGVLVPDAGYTITFTGANPVGTENRYQYTSANGFFTNNLNGGVADGASVTANVSATVNGQTATQPIQVNTNTAAAGQIVSSQLVSVSGTTLRLPRGTTYPFKVVNVLGNGTRSNAPFSATGATAGDISFEPTGLAALGSATFTAPGAAVAFGNAAATGTLTLRRTNNPAGSGFTTIATIAVTLEDTTAATATPWLRLVPSSNAVRVGQKLPYKVEFVSANGNVQDITPVTIVAPTGAITVVDTDPTQTTVRTGLATAGAAPGAATIQFGVITQAGLFGANPAFVPPAGTTFAAANVTGSPANITVTP